MIRRNTALAVALVSTVGLTGCVGGSTYGTGVSQEAQLVSDLTGLVSLGQNKEKPKIDYSARPKLVRAPADGTLPTPAEQAGESESAYFPTNPEERRAARLAGTKTPPPYKDGGTEYTLPGDAGGPSASFETYKKRSIGRDFDGTGDVEPSAAEMARSSKEGRAERLKRFREITGNGGLSSGPRRYLTQPPQEYRTPSEAAAVGDVGEYEYGENEKKPLFGTSIFGSKKDERKQRPTEESPAIDKKG